MGRTPEGESAGVVIELLQFNPFTKPAWAPDAVSVPSRRIEMPSRFATLGRPSFWIGVGLAPGLFLRFYHAGRNPLIWHDEAALVINLLLKYYSELLGPLYWVQPAPPFFLWSERSMVLLHGE